MKAAWVKFARRAHLRTVGRWALIGPGIAFWVVFAAEATGLNRVPGHEWLAVGQWASMGWAAVTFTYLCHQRLTRPRVLSQNSGDIPVPGLNEDLDEQIERARAVKATLTRVQDARR